MGRMTEYSPEIADAICELIAEGKSIRTICKVDEMPAMSTIFKWLSEQSKFSEQYARAKEVQAECLADELVEIADDISNDVTGELEMPNAVAVQRAKLRVDTRKWIASKLLAKKYGDKLAHTGADGEGPVQFVVTRAGTKEK